MLDGLDNASIEIKEAKVCVVSYLLPFFPCYTKCGSMVEETDELDIHYKVLALKCFLLSWLYCHSGSCGAICFYFVPSTGR